MLYCPVTMRNQVTSSSLKINHTKGERRDQIKHGHTKLYQVQRRPNM